MNVNADFSQRVVVRPDEERWAPSPQAGVERLYARPDWRGDRTRDKLRSFCAGSRLSQPYSRRRRRNLMLDGAFEDQNGVHAAGAYLRDPIGSSHAPSSPSGCTLFVKLWQFDTGDRGRVEIDTASSEWRKTPEGFAIQPLHHFAGVMTFLVRLDPGATLNRTIHPLGEEIVVLAGACSDAEGTYPACSWIRDPGGHDQALFSGRRLHAFCQDRPSCFSGSRGFAFTGRSDSGENP